MKISLTNGVLIGAGFGIVFAFVWPVIFGEGPIFYIPNDMPGLLESILGGGVGGAFWGVIVVWLYNRFNR